MNPEILERGASSIMNVFAANAGGFVFVSLGFMVATFFLVRADRRHRAAQDARIASLEIDLKECNNKHDVEARAREVVSEKTANLKMSLSSLWTIVQLSGDRRMSKFDLAELLDGKISLMVNAPSEGDQRESASVVKNETSAK